LIVCKPRARTTAHFTKLIADCSHSARQRHI
jgi:hypothetical protein